ncbi:hypothetical protein [Planotetraspora sp. GP83]|uniref:hypothetical protein n=1 Tax=Planotetraspora sp. GP83 TaxID=3156264 RepID=UPI003515A4C9
MNRDQLVATGCREADAYLKAGLAGLPAEQEAASSRAAWKRAVGADDQHAGFHGTAERRQRAERLYDQARRALAVAQAAEKQALLAAEEADPRAAALATAELQAARGEIQARRASRATEGTERSV